MKLENIKKGNQYIYNYGGNAESLKQLNGLKCTHNHSYLNNPTWIGVTFENGTETIAYPEQLEEI